MAPYQWQRLVRYTSTAGDEIRYGEPLLNPDQINQITSLAESNELLVKRLQGTSWDNLEATTEIDRVSQLLGPLRPADVPIIRCTGINYKTHSM